MAGKGNPVRVGLIGKGNPNRVEALPLTIQTGGLRAKNSVRGENR